MKNRLSVILPTYNEAENIRPLIDALKASLNEVHEIIVVDDSSPDGTADIVADMAASGSYPFLRLERRISDHGLTNSIQRGIDLATGDAIGWMDCDFSMSPDFMPVLLALINADYDVAVGSRFILGGIWRNPKEEKNELFLSVALSRLMNFFIQICLDHKFKDYTSGFVVARRQIFDRISLKGDYGEYFIDFLYRALKLKYNVVEVPYIWRKRRSGKSKTGSTLKDYTRRGWKYIATTLRLVFTRKYD